jgi:hypothetical protein
MSSQSTLMAVGLVQAQIRRQTTRVHAGVAIRPELDPRPYESAVSC